MAQLLLQINGKLYKGNIRGEADQELYAAAKRFQEKLGRTGTGILDNELIFRMIDGAGGTRHFAIIVKGDVLPSLERAIAESGADADRKYGHSAAPKQGSISEDFNNRSEEARKLALATYLSARGSKCTLPVIDAQQMVPDVVGQVQRSRLHANPARGPIHHHAIGKGKMNNMNAFAWRFIVPMVAGVLSKSMAFTW